MQKLDKQCSNPTPAHNNITTGITDDCDDCEGKYHVGAIYRSMVRIQHRSTKRRREDGDGGGH